jgi:hypothetical protein
MFFINGNQFQNTCILLFNNDFHHIKKNQNLKTGRVGQGWFLGFVRLEPWEVFPGQWQ